jgi:hypothetical protein
MVSRSLVSDPDEGETATHETEELAVHDLVRSPDFQNVTAWLGGSPAPCVPEKDREVGLSERAKA